MRRPAARSVSMHPAVRTHFKAGGPAMRLWQWGAQRSTRPSGALGEEDPVPLLSDLRIAAAVRVSTGLRYEAKPELGARKPAGGTGRGERAEERSRVGRRHRVARAELLPRAGRFPLDLEADGRRHEEGARELEGVN